MEEHDVTAMKEIYSYPDDNLQNAADIICDEETFEMKIPQTSLSLQDCQTKYFFSKTNRILVPKHNNKITLSFQPIGSHTLMPC